MHCELILGLNTNQEIFVLSLFLLMPAISHSAYDNWHPCIQMCQASLCAMYLFLFTIIVMWAPFFFLPAKSPGAIEKEDGLTHVKTPLSSSYESANLSSSCVIMFNAKRKRPCQVEHGCNKPYWQER